MILTALSKPLLSVAGVIIAALMALLAVQTSRLSAAHTTIAQLKEEAAWDQVRWSNQVAESATALAKAHEDARNEERRRMEAVALATATEARLRTARMDAAAARVSADRLRDDHQAALSALRIPAATPGDPSAAAGGPTASQLADVLTLVQRSIDDFAGTVALEADERYIAGAACERAYDAVRGVP